MAESLLQQAPIQPENAADTAGTRRTWSRLLWPLLIAGLIFVASSRARVAGPGLTAIDDKFAHFAVYGLLATLVCRVGGGGRAALVAVVVTSAFGASDEWHQSYVPGRMADFGDWVADTLGALLAVGLYARWRWYRELLERPVRWSKVK
jgi:VanZ family protein